MNSWQQVRVTRDEDGDGRVVITETAPEPAQATDRDADTGLGNGAEVLETGESGTARQHPAKVARVLPRPDPVVCTTCSGVGTLRVLDSASQITWTGTSVSAVPTVSPVRYRQTTCGACSGLGWVLVAFTGPVRPATVPLPAPAPVPWWQQVIGDQVWRGPNPGSGGPALPGLGQVWC